MLAPSGKPPHMSRHQTQPSKKGGLRLLFGTRISERQSVALHPDVHFSFQVVGLGAEDGLYTGTSHHHTGGAQLLQTSLVNLGHILHTDTQTGDAGVQRGDVLFATEGGDQCSRHLVLALTGRGLLGSFVFTTRVFRFMARMTTVKTT